LDPPCRVFPSICWCGGTVQYLREDSVNMLSPALPHMSIAVGSIFPGATSFDTRVYKREKQSESESERKDAMKKKREEDYRGRCRPTQNCPNAIPDRSLADFYTPWIYSGSVSQHRWQALIRHRLGPAGTLSNVSVSVPPRTTRRHHPCTKCTTIHAES